MVPSNIENMPMVISVDKVPRPKVFHLFRAREHSFFVSRREKKRASTIFILFKMCLSTISKLY